MTIEEKAQHYDEAIEKLRDFYRDYDTVSRLIDVKEELANLIPELKESEDERVRNKLIEFFKGYSPDEEWWGNITQENILAWLEKQGEQKPAWSEEDETIKKNISHIIRQYDKISKKENQPCWYIGDCLLWMQNIKDRVQPKPKQEWSEEDENMLSDIVKDLVHPWNEYIPDRIEDEIKWLENKLKSFRPQSQWKPSDEQMNALESAIVDSISSIQKHSLESLYNELKKLF